MFWELVCLQQLVWKKIATRLLSKRKNEEERRIVEIGWEGQETKSQGCTNVNLYQRDLLAYLIIERKLTWQGLSAKILSRAELLVIFFPANRNECGRASSHSRIRCNPPFLLMARWCTGKHHGKSEVMKKIVFFFHIVKFWTVYPYVLENLLRGEWCRCSFSSHLSSPIGLYVEQAHVQKFRYARDSNRAHVKSTIPKDILLPFHFIKITRNSVILNAVRWVN